MQYRGALMPAQAAQGINVACENSRHLNADAQLLFDAGRILSAASLPILAIGEAG